MSDYEKSLEDSIEKLNDRIAKLSYVIQPHFKIFEKDDKVYAIQLYADFKGGEDPFQKWTKYNGEDGDHSDVQDSVATFSVKFSYDKIQNIVAHAEINEKGEWLCKLFTGRHIMKNFNYKDNIVNEIKQMLLEETGLSGFVATENKQVYVSKEESLKAVLGETSKWYMKHDDTGSVRTPVGGFSQYTMPIIKNLFDRINKTP